MKFTLYTSNCIGNAKNNIYSNKVEIESVDDLLTAVSYDHVCAEYKNNHRSVSNYIFSNVEVMDCETTIQMIGFI